MKRIIFFIMLIILPLNSLNAEDLYFTYVGAVIGVGMDQIEYNDWFEDQNRRDSKSVSGQYYSGGAIIDIFVDQLIGEFGVQFINNSSDEEPDISVSHVIYSAKGKYSFHLIRLLPDRSEYISTFDPFYLTAGAGLYMETPPANRGYDSGGGFNLTLGAMYKFSREWILLFDAIGRYGHFGIGEDSTRFSYGINLALVYKVGRI